jgi:hypothetical protein
MLYYFPFGGRVCVVGTSWPLLLVSFLAGIVSFFSVSFFTKLSCIGIAVTKESVFAGSVLAGSLLQLKSAGISSKDKPIQNLALLLKNVDCCIVWVLIKNVLLKLREQL